MQLTSFMILVGQWQIIGNCGTTIQIVVYVYMSYYHTSNEMQNQQFVDTMDALQAFTDAHGDTTSIKIIRNLNNTSTEGYVNHVLAQIARF